MAEFIMAAAKKPEAKKENRAPLTQKMSPSQSISSPVEQILFLQRTIGNQAVAKLIKSWALQAKLRIGQPGDIYEQEADRVAEQVMRMPEPKVTNETKVSNPARNNSIQRKCPGCNKGIKIEKEEEEADLSEGAIVVQRIVEPDIEEKFKPSHRKGPAISKNQCSFLQIQPYNNH